MKNFSDYLEIIQESSKKGETAKPEAPSYFKKINKKAVESTLDELINELKKGNAFNIIIKIKKDEIENFKDKLKENNFGTYRETKITKDGVGSKSYRQITGLDKYKAAAYVELNFNYGVTDHDRKDKHFYDVREKIL